jgi:replicative DNA helicase
LTDLSDFTMSYHAPDPPPDDGSAPLVEPEEVQSRSRYERSYSATIPDLNLDAGLPANIDAERTILGAILLDNHAFSEAAETIVADDFSLDSHRRIFLRMSELIDAQKTVDIVTLSEELSRWKEIEAIGGVAYLASLTEGLPRRPVISDYVRIVKDKAMLRRMMGVCSTAIARAADQSEDALGVLEFAEGELLQIAQEANTGKLRTVADSVEDAGGLDPYMKPITDPDVMPGLPSGFLDLDSLIGGLKKQELFLIAARPSQGKSAWLLNLAENVCVGTDKVAAIFSLEMSRTSLERRLLAGIARVDVRRATTGAFLSRTERDKLTEALVKLVDSGIYIDDSPSQTVTQMRAKARRLKQRVGRLDLIGLDYLQMARSGSKKYENRQVEVADISRGLKAMAKELDTSVVALSQVGRSAEQRQDKRPTLADLRESGAQEADADVVCLIHRPEYYDRDNQDLKGIAEIICAKNREGPTGVVKLAYISEFTRFVNLARS